MGPFNTVLSGVSRIMWASWVNRGPICQWQPAVGEGSCLASSVSLSSIRPRVLEL